MDTARRRQERRLYISHARQVWFRRLGIALSCLGFAGYFAVHTLHGRHGLEARDRLIDRAMVNEHQIGGLETAIEALSADVAALDQTPPDDDAVVSFARKQLGYGYPDEQVYRLPDAAARP